MKIKVGLYISFLFLLSASLFAQNVFEDGDGVSTIEIFDREAGLININSEDKKVSLNYVKYVSNTQKLPWMWYGLDISGKTKNSIGSIFDSNDISKEAAAELKFGFRLEGTSTILTNNEVQSIQTIFQNDKGTKAQDSIENLTLYRLKTGNNVTKSATSKWLVTKLRLSGSRFNHIQPLNSIGSQLVKERFTGINFSVGYNIWVANLFKTKMRLVGGITVGIERNNNLDDLDEKTFQKTDSVDLGIAFEEKAAFEGDLINTTALPINIDLYFSPQSFSNLGFNVFMKNAIPLSHDGVEMGEEEEGTITKVGLGFFIFENNRMLSPKGGLSFSVNDIFNQDTNDKNDDFWDRFNISLLASIRLPSFK